MVRSVRVAYRAAAATADTVSASSSNARTVTPAIRSRNRIAAVAGDGGRWFSPETAPKASRITVRAMKSCGIADPGVSARIDGLAASG